MILHFKAKYPQLNKYWDKYLAYQQRLEVPAKTVLLKEGQTSKHYIYIEQGCVRAAINNKGEDKTIQFFFEHDGLSSFESFVNETPGAYSIETIEPCVVYLLPKTYVNLMLQELSAEPQFLQLILKISAERQAHYMNEFVSFIRDTAEERYERLLNERPHIIKRVAQHYIASYLGVSKVHLSRIKRTIMEKNSR